MNLQLFPVVATVVGFLLVAYTVRMFVVLRRRARAVAEARTALETTSSSAKRTSGNSGDDDNKRYEIMIKRYNDREGAYLLYNRAVVLYNQLLTTHPSAFFGYMFGFEKERLYDIADDSGSATGSV